MAGMTEKPESPSDIAILAVRVCSELQAYIEGIRALYGAESPQLITSGCTNTLPPYVKSIHSAQERFTRVLRCFLYWLRLPLIVLLVS